MLILLNGLARSGKTTMQKHLMRLHPELTILDAATPFKCLLGLGYHTHDPYAFTDPLAASFRSFRSLHRELGREGTLDHFAGNQKSLLESYEALKSQQPVTTRDACIAISEFVKLFDPEFWVKASIKMAPASRYYIGDVLDDIEMDAWRNFYNGEAYVASLDCTDREPVGDTRKLLGYDSVDYYYYYELRDSKRIAEEIYRDARNLKSLKD